MTTTESTRAVNVVIFTSRDCRFFDAATGEELSDEDYELSEEICLRKPAGVIVADFPRTDGTVERRPLGFIGTSEQAAVEGIRFEDEP